MIKFTSSAPMRILGDAAVKRDDAGKPITDDGGRISYSYPDAFEIKLGENEVAEIPGFAVPPFSRLKDTGIVRIIAATDDPAPQKPTTKPVEPGGGKATGGAKASSGKPDDPAPPKG